MQPLFLIDKHTTIPPRLLQKKRRKKDKKSSISFPSRLKPFPTFVFCTPMLSCAPINNHFVLTTLDVANSTLFRDQLKQVLAQGRR